MCVCVMVRTHVIEFAEETGPFFSASKDFNYKDNAVFYKWSKM